MVTHDLFGHRSKPSMHSNFIIYSVKYIIEAERCSEKKINFRNPHNWFGFDI